MSINKMGAPFRYVLIDHSNSNTEYAFSNPKGWETLTSTLTRGDYFGVNSEQSVPLLFCDEYRTLLKSLYDSKGVFANCSLRIEERQDDWSYQTYDTFKLDFNTFADDMDYIELKISENSFRAEIDAKIDVEYELELPASSDYLYYESARSLSTNILQCLTGKNLPTNIFYTVSGEDNYRFVNGIRANRANREFTDIFAFTYKSGNDYIPYESTRFRLLKKPPINSNVVFTIKLTTEIPYFLQPAQGLLAIVKYEYNEVWGSVDYYNPIILSVITGTNSTSSRDLWAYKTTIFDSSFTVDMNNHNTGDVFELAILQQIGYEPSVIECSNAIISLTAYTSNGISGFIRCFDHNWLITELVKRIYPTGLYDNDITWGITNYPMIIADDCIRKYPSITSTRKVKCSLENALKSLDVLECIAVDITGTTLTTKKREDAYTSTKADDVNCNNLKESVDTEHIFSSIKIGWECDNFTEKGNYAFNCTKVFEIQGATNKNELSIIHPFKGDQYSIDKWISDIAGEESKSNDTGTDMAIIMCDILSTPDPITGAGIIMHKGDEISTVNWNGDTESAYNIAITPSRIWDKHKKYINISNYKSSNVIIFASSSIDTNLASKITGVESVLRYENADKPYDADILFEPILIEFDTEGFLEALKAIKSNKYAYIRTVYRGIYYDGWVSTVVSSIGQETSQSWSLHKKKEI